MFNQTNIGTVSRATLGRLLRDGAERVWAFPGVTMPYRAETGNWNWLRDLSYTRCTVCAPRPSPRANESLNLVSVRCK